MCSFVVVGNVTKADPAQLYAQSNVLWAFLILGPTLNHSCNFFVYVMSNKRSGMNWYRQERKFSANEYAIAFRENGTTLFA